MFDVTYYTDEEYTDGELKSPYNLTLHEYLIGLGYRYRHQKGQILGGPWYLYPYDEYIDHDEVVYVTHCGEMIREPYQKQDKLGGDWQWNEWPSGPYLPLPDVFLRRVKGKLWREV
jgi:hypothetical protein